MPHATTFKATIGSFNASMKAMIGSFNASIPKIHISEYKKQGTHKLVHFSHSHIELYRSPLGIHTTEDSLALHDTGQLGLNTTLQQLTHAFCLYATLNAYSK